VPQVAAVDALDALLGGRPANQAAACAAPGCERGLIEGQFCLFAAAAGLAPGPAARGKKPGWRRAGAAAHREWRQSGERIQSAAASTAWPSTASMLLELAAPACWSLHRSGPDPPTRRPGQQRRWLDALAVSPWRRPSARFRAAHQSWESSAAALEAAEADSRATGARPPASAASSSRIFDAAHLDESQASGRRFEVEQDVLLPTAWAAAGGG